jgi:hypothetical protein
MVQLFERFTQMIEKLPSKGVLAAVQLERQMLEDDLAHKRTVPIEDVRSIVAFCNFLENTAAATQVLRSAVPMNHIGFYREIVKRMVADGELPGDANKQFDTAFSVGAFNTMTEA